MTPNTTQRHRPGFTLIELLVVLIIIGILIALLVPAIASAVKAAQSAAVQAEINQLAQALADFKNKFGDYPPSRIIVREDGGTNPSLATMAANGATADVSQGQLYQRTVTAFRKFWPRVGLNTNGNAFMSATNWYDFNGNGTFDGTSPILLQGNECLVFFLGGIPQQGPNNTIMGMTGFSKNPTNPFMNNITGNADYSGNRTSPLFEFSGPRLRMNPTTGMASYVDSINATNSQATAVYAYFSTNNGVGYDANDVNAAEADNNLTSPITLMFLSNQPIVGGGSYIPSPSPNPYTTGTPAPFSSGTTGSGVGNVVYQSPQSFQIMSSGSDGVFGLGGIYDPVSGLTPEDQTSALGTAFNAATKLNLSSSSDSNVRIFENDNLTNFHNGKLQ